MPYPILTRHDPEAAAEFHARGWWGHETLYSIAARHAQVSPQRMAYRDKYRSLDWSEAVAAADALCADLAARGLRAGHRVVFWLPDRIESAIILLAASRGGFVACPSPHRNHTVAEVVTMVSRLSAAAFFYQPGFGADVRGEARVDAVRDALQSLPSVRHIYRLDAVSKDDAQRGVLSGQLLPASERPISPVPERSADRVSYIAFTSGSTGNPKGVLHSDNTLLVTAKSLVKDWKVSKDDVVSTLSPFSHNLGIGAMLTALVAGAELVIHDTSRGESIADRLIEVGATYIVGVPTHAIDLMEDLKRKGLDRLGRVRAFRVSGAASPPHLMRELMAFGIEPQSGYGMTENNSHQYTRPGDDPELVARSCGRACEGYEIGIFDPEDRERRLPAGEKGLVGGRGACLMLGYFGDQAATENAFNSTGWFLTGDIGELDERGYLRLTGRLKEILIRGGHNISPGKIEDLASEFPGIARAAVLAVPDARLGERICLAYVGSDGAVLDAGKLNRFLTTKGLSRYELPEYLLALAEMPLMANGKIDKPKLIKAIDDGGLVPVAV